MNAVQAKTSKSRKRPYNDWCKAVFQKQGGDLPSHAVIEDDVTTPAPRKQQPLLKAAAKAAAKQVEEHASTSESAVITQEERARAETLPEAHFSQSALRRAIDKSASGSGVSIVTGIEGVAIAESASKGESIAVSSEMDSAESSLDKALAAAKKTSNKRKKHRHH